MTGYSLPSTRESTNAGVSLSKSISIIHVTTFALILRVMHDAYECAHVVL